jgi:hypothetical protein
MKKRCTNPKNADWARYGGRGIKVHPTFQTYSGFKTYLLATIGMRPAKGFSLDRVNNDGHYEPGNIRWATAEEQANNRRLPMR